MDFSDFIQNSIRPKKEEKNHIDSVSLKKGMMIRVIYKKNSTLNYYKGYIGEIMSYNHRKKQAIVFLHATVNFQILHFPVDHLILLD
jgi:hypothetical protein